MSLGAGLEEEALVFAAAARALLSKKLAIVSSRWAWKRMNDLGRLEVDLMCDAFGRVNEQRKICSARYILCCAFWFS